MRILILSWLLLLGGCSTLSEEQCRNSDWYQRGYQDGQQGRSHSRLQEYADACREYGIQPDGPRWQEGYQSGLTLYCLPELAFAKGRDGQRYLGVCPNDGPFRAEYDRGYGIYRLHAEVTKLEGDLTRLHAQQDRLWHQYQHTKEHRHREELRHRLQRLEWDERDLRHALRHARELASQADEGGY